MTVWQCNRCNRAYAQDRIPSRCECGAQEFRLVEQDAIAKAEAQS